MHSNQSTVDITKLLTARDRQIIAMGVESNNFTLNIFELSREKSASGSARKSRSKQVVSSLQVSLKHSVATGFSPDNEIKIMDFPDHYIFVRFNCLICKSKASGHQHMLFGDKKSCTVIKDFEYYLSHIFLIYSNKLVILPISQDELAGLSLDIGNAKEFVFDSFALLESVQLSCNKALIVVTGYSQKLFDK